jgi:SAM-dependent methyltransferase
MRFDAGFYRRYYRDPATRVSTGAEQARLARFACAFAASLGFRVRRVLDAGCGLGYMREAVRQCFPGARYVGLEPSDYLARRYGWVHGRLEDYRPAAAFDLILCHDVLQYLDDRAAARAIANLGRISRGALYLTALTLEDWRSTADRSRSDGGVHLRPAEWYRRRLARNFRPVGAGMLVRRGHAPVLWELERPWPAAGGSRRV